MNSKIVDQMPSATPSTPFDDSSEDAINAAVDLELAAAVGGVRGRSRKSCRLGWCNQLDPCLKRKPFTGKLNSSPLDHLLIPDYG
ncbi:unnamed protein product [Brassica oleracea var. botrytis]